jgi:hypothetical protein
MTASSTRNAPTVDLSAAAVTALEEALADKPLTLMIVAEYRDGDRVRIFSVPESPALQRGLHLMAEPLIWPEIDQGDE